MFQIKVIWFIMLPILKICWNIQSVPSKRSDTKHYSLNGPLQIYQY